MDQESLIAGVWKLKLDNQEEVVLSKKKNGVAASPSKLKDKRNKKRFIPYTSNRNLGTVETQPKVVGLLPPRFVSCSVITELNKLIDSKSLIVKGNILKLDNPERAVICQQVNCVAVKTHGLSTAIAEKYGSKYNPYASRRVVPKRNLATQET